MRFSLITLLLLSGLASAQITLTNADFADGGDTVRVSSATDPTIDFLSTGSNYTWDFSGLVAESQTLKDYDDLSSASTLVQFLFGAFAPADYQATNAIASSALPLNQIGGLLPVNISEVNQLSKNSADSITSIGFTVVADGIEVPFRSDTIETRYKFPANFGDVYSSRGYSNMDLNPIYDAQWIQYRQRSSNIDGWGSITTPFGTFDALRIRHSIQEQDSIYIGQFGQWVELPIPPSNSYEWWGTGELEPILRIITSDVGGTESVTAIEFRDAYDPALVGTEELSTEITIYPNPAQEQIILEGVETGSSYLVLTADGKQVLSGIVGASLHEISLNDLSAGGYVVFVRNTNGSFGQSTFLKH